MLPWLKVSKQGDIEGKRVCAISKHICVIEYRLCGIRVCVRARARVCVCNEFSK